MVNFDGAYLLNPHNLAEHLVHFDPLLALGPHGFDPVVDLLVADQWAGVYHAFGCLLVKLVLASDHALLTEAVELLRFWVQLGRRDQGDHLGVLEGPQADVVDVGHHNVGQHNIEFLCWVRVAVRPEAIGVDQLISFLYDLEDA